MKRLSKHPVVRKDAMFRAFLQEKDVAKTLKPLVTMKGGWNNFKEKFSLFRSRIVVKEKDPWFQVNTGFFSLAPKFFDSSGGFLKLTRFLANERKRS